MGWLADHAWEAWLIAAVALGCLELLSLDMIFIMLAGGALVGTLSALFGVPGILQVVLALITAVGLLALIRPGVLRSLHAGPELRTGADRLIGSRATVLQELSGHHPGRVKIGGEEWSALPYDEDETIPQGEVVDIVQIKGATAYVLRVPKLEG
ncbi:MAG TPA: NfeD family protein [Marmoricola sp.]|nr:NfeD family protein [Marmoricola sp.]